MTTLRSRLDRRIGEDPRPRSVRELRSLLRSPRRDVRLLALLRIRRQIADGPPRKGYLSLARPLTRDGDSRCRWQATIVVGEYIRVDPDRIWRLARQLGRSKVADIREAAATVLLEHLLELHPRTIADRCRRELNAGDPNFAKTLALCWNFGRGGARRRIQRLIDEARARRRKR